MLRLEDVHSYYGDSHVVQGVSLTVERGETVALVGRNGAGKTTLLKTIMGIVPARRGRVLLDGADVTGLPTHRIARRGITLVPEDRRIFPRLTVAENLRVASWRPERAAPPRGTACSSTSRASASGSTRWARTSRAASSRCWRWPEGSSPAPRSC